MIQLALKPQLPSPEPNVPGFASLHPPAPFYALLEDAAALLPNSSIRLLNVPEIYGWWSHFNS
jgi:hypothetical protein